MAFAFTPAPSAGRRLAPTRRPVDWRAVALTAGAAVLLIASLGHPV